MFILCIEFGDFQRTYQGVGVIGRSTDVNHESVGLGDE